MPPKTSKNTPPYSRRTKRARLHDPQAGAETTAQDATAQEKSSQVTSSPFKSSNMLSYDEFAASYESEPLSSKIERYKEWRRNGSSNEHRCRVCGRTGRLQPCHTCKLSFHSYCMPSGWIRDSSRKWFCPICVQHNWHVSPPHLTPPGSPEPAPSTVPSADTTTPVSHNPLSNGRSQEAAHLPNPDPAPRGRRSRFATLSSEVDASLALLYRECESAAVLKEQVVQLQEENSRCLQIIKIRDQDLIALHRQIGNKRISDEELEALKSKADKYDTLMEELNELRANNITLERRLQAANEEATKNNAALDEWKIKLTRLIQE